jgi:hypothetical protein
MEKKNRAAHKKTEQRSTAEQSKAEHNSAWWHKHNAGGRAHQKSQRMSGVSTARSPDVRQEF